MSSKVLNAPRTIQRSEVHSDLGQLLKRFGKIPAERVRLWPPPGSATLKDLIAHNDHAFRTAICEWIDGTLVERAVDFSCAEAASLLAYFVHKWNQPKKIVMVVGAGGVVRLTRKLARSSHLSCFRMDRFPDEKRPPGSVPLMIPDFAVEILSKSNTKNEMKRKRGEYFAAGTRLMWEVDLKTQTVVVYLVPDTGTTFGIDDTLDGGDVLPGFRLSIREWFESLSKE